MYKDKDLWPAASDVVFAEHFDSRGQVMRNGGTITGTPTIKNGIATLSEECISYPSLSSVGFNTDDGFTTAFWFKGPKNQDGYLVATVNSTWLTGWGLYLATAYPGILFLYYGLGGVATLVQTDSSFVDSDSWIHICVVYENNGSVSFYKNGSLYVTSGIIPITTSNNPFVIGNRNGGTTAHRIEGQFKKEVIVSNRPYTAQEVSDIHTSQTFNFLDKAEIILPMQHKIGGGASNSSGFYTPNIGTANLISTPGELVTDSDMSLGDTSAWTAFNNANLSKVGGYLRIQRDGTNNPQARQTVGSVVADRIYRVQARFRSDGSAIPYVYFGGAAGVNLIHTGTNSTSDQEIDFIVGATTDGTLILMALTSTGTEYVEFGSVSVTEVDGVQLGNGHASTTFPTKLDGENGFYFDGGDYMVVADDPLLDITGPISVVVWMRRQPGSGEGGIIDKSSGGIAKNAPYSLWLTANKFRGFRGDGVAAIGVTDTENLPYGIERFFVFTDDRIKLRLHKNAVEVDQTNSAFFTPVGNGLPLYFGAMDATTFRLYGDILCGALFTFALTPTQIKYLYHLGPEAFRGM